MIKESTSGDEMWAIYCIDPDDEATGYVGWDQNYFDFEDFFRTSGFDWIFSSEQEAQDVIDRDPLMQEYINMYGWEYRPESVINEVEELMSESRKTSKPKMRESVTLKVYDKNGKLIDHQAGFKDAKEARGFLSYNDDRYPIGYTYEIDYGKMKESYNYKIFDELVREYSLCDTKSPSRIYKEILARYNDKDLANDVVEELQADPDWHYGFQESEESKVAEAESVGTTLAPSHWAVVRTSTMGSALGEDVANLEAPTIAEFDTKEEAEKRAEELNKGVLPEEKELFGTEYKVSEIKQKSEEK